jgi:PPOX class probable FMN-dependent enzyme
MAMDFKDVITEPGQFRELMGEPPPPCVAKTIPILDQHCRAFIARAPFLLIASSNARGQVDISPKGDAPGFVRVLDDKTLAVPDRPGNRRADTFTNVLENPKVGLIFLVPGKSETLRVSGSAKIVRDADLRGSMAARGKTPDFALAVEVEEAFFHCSKCIIRSSLWTPEAWPTLDGLPSLAQTMVDAAALPMPVEALEEIIKQDEAERLY